MITRTYTPSPEAITNGILANQFLRKGNPALERIVFWARKKKRDEGFFKFQGPCNHVHYRVGDSLAEEIGCSSRQFREYKKEFCTSYSSETAFRAEADPFKGMPVACYFNRAKKVTWYFLNEENLTKWQEGRSSFTGALPTIFRSASARLPLGIYIPNKKNISPLNPPLRKMDPKSKTGEVGNLKNDSENLESEISEIVNPEIEKSEPLGIVKIENPPETPDIPYNPSKKEQLIRRERIIKRQKDRRRNGPKKPIQAHRGQVEVSKVDFPTKSPNMPSAALKTANKMDRIWRERTKGLIKTPKLSSNMALRMIEALKKSFSGSLEQWDDYCKRVGSSKFLTGQTGSSYQLWLVKAIEPTMIEKIRAGEYGVDTTIGLPEVHEDSGGEEHSKAEVERSLEEASNSRLELDLRRMLLEKHGSKTYNSWFRDLRVHEVDGILQVIAASRFKANWVETNFKKTFEVFAERNPLEGVYFTVFQ